MPPQNIDLEIPDGMEDILEKSEKVMDKKTQKEQTKDQEKQFKQAKQMKKEELKNPGPELEAKRQKLIRNLIVYGQHERFGERLKKGGFTLTAMSLKDKSLEELEAMFKEIQICIRSHGRNGFFTSLATAGIVLIEDVCTKTQAIKTRFDISGLALSLSTNETFKDNIYLLELEYNMFADVRPELQLLITIAMAAVGVAGINAAKAAVDKNLQSIRDAEVNKTAAPQPTATAPAAAGTASSTSKFNIPRSTPEASVIIEDGDEDEKKDEFVYDLNASVMQSYSLHAQ